MQRHKPDTQQWRLLVATAIYLWTLQAETSNIWTVFGGSGISTSHEEALTKGPGPSHADKA